MPVGIRAECGPINYNFLMHPKSISIADYHYELPAERIAHYPLANRDASKLLIYRDGEIREDIYRHIAAYLPEGAMLVFNNTKVVEARIVFQKPTGGQIEIFCLEPPSKYGGIGAALTQRGKVEWKCLIGGASKWKNGQELRKTVVGNGEDIVLQARYLEKLEDSFLVELSWTPAGFSFAELLHQAGLIPLPPYIQRAAEASDQERYQTIYSRYEGSVAAPTAGLHFTEAIFDSLDARHIQRAFLTLHVGAGTFLPVKAPTMEQHPMHIEYISVTRDTIRELLDAIGARRPVIPVGTTSARTLESLYWLGVKTLLTPAIAAEDMILGQWDAYDNPNKEGAPAALEALLQWLERRGLTQLVTQTQLLITPGYEWKICGGLVTNFHQPESTLLLLVASLVGKDWKDIYGYALTHGFRFLSYGDGCLFLPGQSG